MSISIFRSLLLLYAVIPDTHQSTDDCYYLPGHPGKKCYAPDHLGYNCCPQHDHCLDGTCYSLGITPAPKLMSMEASIFIGISVAVVAMVCLVIAAMYWHRRQMRSAEPESNMLTSFSTSLSNGSRRTNSAGFRIHSSTSLNKSSQLESSSASASCKSTDGTAIV